jgi:hypothetical protein
VDNNYLDLDMNKSEFVHTVTSGRPNLKTLVRASLMVFLNFTL